MVCAGLGGSTEAQPVVTRFLKWRDQKGECVMGRKESKCKSPWPL